ncbi:MAG: DUF6364 family protein [Bacteroidia bacterium]
MDTKLTLKLEQSVIEKAKEYATSKHTSLSKLVEGYLQNILQDTATEKQKITPLVKSLSGIIKLPKDYDHKKGYTNYLTDKYK